MMHDIVELPCNREAEQALLGALLLNNEVFSRVAHLIAAEDFYEPVHAMIFEAIAKFVSDGKKANPVTIQGAIRLMDMGGVDTREYVSRLAASATTISGAPDYALSVVEAAHRRALISAADEIKARALVADVMNPPAKMVDDAMTALAAIGGAGKAAHAETVSVGSAAAQFIERAQEIAAGRLKVDLIKTGIGALDRTLGGIARGNLVIIAGRPGQGKSALALQIALNISRSAPVLYLSLEMTNDEFAQRALSSLAYDAHQTELGYSMLRDPRGLKRHDLQRLADAERQLREYGLMLHDEPGVTIEQVALRASMVASRLSVQGKALSAVVVDHLGLIRRPKGIASTVHQIEAITNALKEMAKRLNVPVFALSQLNRAVEQRDDKRPQLSDLRDSGSIEQDADAVIGVYRDDYYTNRNLWVATETQAAPKGPNVIEALVLKNRHGTTGPVELWCDMPHNIIAERQP